MNEGKNALEARWKRVLCAGAGDYDPLAHDHRHGAHGYRSGEGGEQNAPLGRAVIVACCSPLCDTFLRAVCFFPSFTGAGSAAGCKAHTRAGGIVTTNYCSEVGAADDNGR